MKTLTAEQLEKRKSTNKKVAKYGCLPIGIFFIIILIIALVTPESDISKHNDLVQQLENCRSAEQFNVVIKQMDDLYNTTDNDSLKQIIKNSIDIKDVLLQSILIKNQFSGWDGSHIKLTEYVKSVMNDPSSFDHIETKYEVLADGLKVYMKFRGKNAFGALVINEILVKTDMQGVILEVISN